MSSLLFGGDFWPSLVWSTLIISHLPTPLLRLNLRVTPQVARSSRGERAFWRTSKARSRGSPILKDLGPKDRAEPT